MIIEEKKHILVVDDDDRIRELIKEYLESNDFYITTARDAEDAKNKIKLIKFDLIILDIMMPGQNGLELTKEIKLTSDQPIILLTAMGETSDRVSGLETGADDYLPKPFEPKELLLRIKNILKRIKKNKNLNPILKFGNIKVDLDKMSITSKEGDIKLNSAEKALLEIMILSVGRVFQREQISKIVKLTKERAVDVMITRLRQKIEPDPKNPKYLQTVRGNGYVLWTD
ncbi:MAG: response regulator transcription factor [Proteobacteria bacterium]|jgi:two-component system, OmpR family, phosphate regulon response regulator OmpR|nr:response regulator transcription factor [Pseudomonadota bacterium]MDA0971257.1 response regulator transcription factor [Pseudomonadota bacterium]MDA0995353.1 response regulator transcription factor [Pseudomonadota bacterium]